MTFSAKVRDLLKRHRLSQADLAEAMGTNQPQISRWLEADRPPQKTAHLLRLSRALETTVDFLIDDGLEAEPGPPALTEDEYYLLRTYRNMVKVGIDVDMLVQRMLGELVIRQVPPAERPVGVGPGGKQANPEGKARVKARKKAGLS